jgi:uncharacterized membrane protein YgcG
MEESGSIFNRENFFLFVAIVLIGLLIAFITEISIATGNCSNNVSIEHCNKPAGDFAVEPGVTTNNILSGCPPDLTGSDSCVIPDVSSLSDAIKICNSNKYINKCNRFIYENNTMKLVPLNGSTYSSRSKNLYVRQNGITTQSNGSDDGYSQTTSEPGSNTSVLSQTTTMPTGAPVTSSSVSTTTGSSGSSTGGGSGGGSGGGGY